MAKGLKEILLRPEIMGLGGTLSVAAAQIANINGGFLTNYGADVFGSFALYSGLRNSYGTNEKVASALTFAAGSAWELGQKFGLFEGRYDTNDFLAYGLATAACVAGDKIIRKVKEKR